MKVNNITSTKFVIPADSNVKFLYNHLSNAVKEHHTPAVFAPDKVEISAITRAQKDGILQKLNEIKAKFTME